MAGYPRLARPLNCGMSAVGVGIAAVVAVGWAGVQAIPWTILLAPGAAALFTAGANALNDYFDRDTDAVNHPDRPIPRGEMSADEALRFAALTFALSLALASLVGLLAVGIVVVNFVVMVAYEKTLKARGAGGNLLIAYLVGSLFVFGGAAAYPGDLAALDRTLVLGLPRGRVRCGGRPQHRAVRPPNPGDRVPRGRPRRGHNLYLERGLLGAESGARAAGREVRDGRRARRVPPGRPPRVKVLGYILDRVARGKVHMTLIDPDKQVAGEAGRRPGGGAPAR